MEEIESIIEIFRANSTLEELLVPGYIDMEHGGRVMHLLPIEVTIRSAVGCLMLSIDPPSGRLISTAIQSPTLPESLLSEPDIEPGFVDLLDLYFSELRKAQMVGVDVFYATRSELGSRSFRAVALRGRDGRILLFDPFWPSGIRLGGVYDYLSLKAELPASGGIVKYDFD